MEQEQLDRIKKTLIKLLALASSPNEHEAALALEKAKELSEKYNIREIDLSEDTKDSFVVDETFVDSMGASPWEKHLIMECTVPFDCETILIPDGIKLGITTKRWKGHIMGAPSDVDMAVTLFKSLRRIINGMGLIYAGKLPSHIVGKEKRDIMNSYCTGIVCAVHDKIKAIYLRPQETTTSLVLYKKDKVTEFKNKKYPRLNNLKNNRELDSLAFYQGFADGEKVGVHTGVLK